MTSKTPIRIGRDYKNQSKMHERAFKKHELRVDRSKLFTDPIVVLNDEQDKKYMEFLKFCRGINKCTYGCPGYIDLTNFSSTPDGGGIRAMCAGCLNYTADESPQAHEYFTWLNKLLDD